MHKTEILNSLITFMKRLKYFRWFLSITTSYSQIFVFFYRNQFLLLLDHHHLFSWSYSLLALYPIAALRWRIRSDILVQHYGKFSIVLTISSLEFYRLSSPYYKGTWLRFGRAGFKPVRRRCGDFLHSFVPKLVFKPTQPPVKEHGESPGSKDAELRACHPPCS